MNLHELILPGIITGVFSVTVALVSVWWKDYLSRWKKENNYEEAVSENDMIDMIAIQEWLDDIRREFDVDRAVIYQFHNGGHLASGASMKKFTLTYESCRPGIASIKRFSQGVLASDYPDWIGTLFKSDYYVCKDCSESENSKEKEDLEQFSVKSSATVPVRDIGEHLVGFITVQSVVKDIDFDAIKQSMLDYSIEISGYLVKKSKN